MQERQVNRLSGWAMLPITIIVWLLLPVVFLYGIFNFKHGRIEPAFIPFFILWLICHILLGYF